MDRQAFFDQAFLLYLGQSSDKQAAATRAAEALEIRDATCAMLFPPQPEQIPSQELGTGLTAPPLPPLEEI